MNLINKEIKRLFFILLISLFGLQGFAQQDPQYSLYMFNPLSVNPGYAGSREVLSAVLIHRSQWISLDGAPETQAFSIHMPLRNKRMGIGLQIDNDKIGPKTTQTLTGAYAYRIKVGKGKLALGLRGGIVNYNFNWDQIEYKDQADGIATNAPENFVIPTIDFGIYYNTSTFYTGIAFDHINQSDFNLINIDTITSNAKITTNTSFTLGKAFLINKSLILKLSTLFRLSNGASNFDLNSGVLFKNKIYFGLSLRSTNAIVLLTEINLTKKLKMGIAYDFDRSEVARSTSGSLEFFLGYDISLFKSKVLSPRYF